MGLRSSRLVLAALLISYGFALGEKPDETALLALWGKHQQDPENHAAIVQDLQAFEQGNAQSPLVTVARGLAAWHLLKAGNVEEAKHLLAEMAPGGVQPVAAAGKEMALRWLTRLDQEDVEAALRKVYASDIEYPQTLAPVLALPVSARPPMTDRWGTAWSYHPAGFKEIDAGPNQTFVLQSGKLGEKSDLKKILTLPYGGGVGLKPEKILPSQDGKAVLMLQGAGGIHAILAEGTTAGDLSFPYFGDAIVILSNGDYWFIQPKPGS